MLTIYFRPCILLATADFEMQKLPVHGKCFRADTLTEARLYTKFISLNEAALFNLETVYRSIVAKGLIISVADLEPLGSETFCWIQIRNDLVSQIRNWVRVNKFRIRSRAFRGDVNRNYAFQV